MTTTAAGDMVESLRHAILKSEKSHYELERESGVDMAIIGRFVRGIRSLKIESAAKLADALGLVLVPGGKRGRK